MNIKNYLSLISACFLTVNAIAQHSITGNFQKLAGQQVSLFGYEGFATMPIDSCIVSENGFLKLHYSEKVEGMGYLVAKDNKAYSIVLADKDIQLKGETLSLPESISILAGKENQLFVQYAEEHQRREQALSAWIYLQKIYQDETLFAKQKNKLQNIVTEIQRIKQEDNDFLKGIAPENYVSWLLPIKKLLSSVSIIAQFRTEEIPATITSFRKLDYADERLYKSGLLNDAIESHYWLLENMGKGLDTVYNEMNISTDLVL
ncbi:MAG: DUF4369 domain-containing protein [Bacteroidota bacterium]